jgi:hypothetical protein
MTRISKLTDTTCHFLLTDASLDSDDVVRAKIHQEGDDAGLSISLSDHSTKTSADGFDDAVVYLEIYDGKPVLRVWADINSEEPTHVIDLSGAHISKRHDVYKGTLYYADEEGKHILDSFEVHAETKDDAKKKVMDDLWDPRLDSASCVPHFEFEE